jgi:hypothetical protein
MSEKRPTVEEIDAETEELLQRAITLKEKVIEDTMEMVDDYLPKTIQEWREKHPREEGKIYRPWQELMAELMSFCREINGEEKISYLYKKTHNITGLQYLGKTTQDPYKYKGSGTRWELHIKKHGYDVTTEILKECQTTSELKKWGEYYSQLWKVVEDPMWANIRPESGDGGDTSGCENYKKAIAARDMSGSNNPMYGVQSTSKGKTYEELHGIEKANQLKQRLRVTSSNKPPLSEESAKRKAQKISETTKGKPKSEEFKQKMKKPKSEDHKKNISASLTGLERSEEHSKNLSKAISASRSTCVHCGFESTKCAITRYHNDNCKHKENKK